jgi:hypothetical protein
MIDLGCLNQPMMMSDRKLSRRVDLGDASERAIQVWRYD